MMRLRAMIFLLCAFCAGCGSFNKPLLPKQGANEPATDRNDEWTRIIQNADVIYLPVETISNASGDDSVTKIVQALRDSGAPFSIAWQGVERDAENQTTSSEPRWSYSGQLREQCKTVMRDTIDTRQLFLGLSRSIRTKLQNGSRLSDDERQLLARGYHTPADGLEDFAEQLATVRGLQEREIENLYRAHVIAGQFAAEKIVSFMRDHAGEKLLVFARRRELSGDCGLPAFVRQKLNLREITLDRSRERTVRPRLVSARGVSRSSWLQVVNRPPISLRDRSHASFPRATARRVVHFFFPAPEEIARL